MILPPDKNYPEMEEIYLDSEDVELMSQKAHPIQHYMVSQTDGTTLDDATGLPLPYLKGFEEAYLNFKKGDGKFKRGYATAVHTVSQNDPWFYAHFLGDPVMPGSQGQDIVFQLAGIYAAIRLELKGRARALGGNFSFQGQILPNAKKIFYRIDIRKKLIQKNLLMFEGSIAVDEPVNIIYEFQDCRIGFYQKEELGITERGHQYYHPNWEVLQENMKQYIETSKRFYEHSNNQ
jgi:3-hydroxyacyl-[acyl-carrier protein] dehydratase/trans-2-decenoyl-[acyl-carrier protein] isomerase